MNQDGIYMSVLDGLVQTVCFRRLGNCTVEQRVVDQKRVSVDPWANEENSAEKECKPNNVS